MTMLEGQHGDGPLTCIRCWWVDAADLMMSEGTMPAQAVRYTALAGPERSLTLVMIIHGWSPHMEISATDSCGHHDGYESAWRLDGCMCPGRLVKSCTKRWRQNARMGHFIHAAFT